MAGIYIHIPFCRQACRYCDFYFTVSLKYKDSYLDSLIKEFSDREKEIERIQFSSVYIGGGTPTVFSKKQLERIIKTINDFSRVETLAEISIEANPDDLNKAYLDDLKELGFNRLSVGIQSFHDKDLDLMRRSHDSRQAINCIENAKRAGFNNISIDLIYGLPGLTQTAWEENVVTALQLFPQHISAYHLSYEPGTVFNHWKKKGKISELEEQDSINQYNKLRKLTSENGFEHYEISNFARQGFRSKHNSTYWSGEKYFGFGPSAHSYNGSSRTWNLASLKNYIECLNDGLNYSETEKLSTKDKYHDYLITSLRRIEGADIEFIRKRFGVKIIQRLMNESVSYIESGHLYYENNFLKMTPAGWLISDQITGKFMIDDEMI